MNPIGPTIGNEKVLRGGGFNAPPKRCTVFLENPQVHIRPKVQLALRGVSQNKPE